MLALAMLTVVWAEQQQAQGRMSSLVSHYSRGNMQLDSISAGIPDYVCAATCLNIFKVDLGRNELPDPCEGICIYVCVCARVYKYNI